MKNKKSKYLKFLFLALIICVIQSCKLLYNPSNDLTKNVFKCYCVDGSIEVYYRNPTYFKNKYYADTSKQLYVKIYFPNFIEDTLQVFINNRMIKQFKMIYGENTNYSIFYDYSKEAKNPIITVKPKGSINDCFQLVVDDRYRLMFISKIEKTWYITYSNFSVPLK